MFLQTQCFQKPIRDWLLRSMDSTMRRVAECALVSRHHRDASSHAGSSPCHFRLLATSRPCLLRLPSLAILRFETTLPFEEKCAYIALCFPWQKWSLWMRSYTLTPQDARPALAAILILESIGWVGRCHPSKWMRHMLFGWSCWRNRAHCLLLIL